MGKIIISNNDYNGIYIASEFHPSNDIKILSAYLKMGIVFLNLQINANSADNLITIENFINNKYLPLFTCYGIYSNMSVSADNNKYRGSSIDTNGKLDIWLSEPLDYNEFLSFIYLIQ